MMSVKEGVSKDPRNRKFTRTLVITIAARTAKPGVSLACFGVHSLLMVPSFSSVIFCFVFVLPFSILNGNTNKIELLQDYTHPAY